MWNTELKLEGGKCDFFLKLEKPKLTYDTSGLKKLQKQLSTGIYKSR
jgi:hypothetical protein